MNWNKIYLYIGISGFKKRIIYTGITRSKEKLIIIGNKDTLQNALKNQEYQRQTSLKDIIKQGYSKEEIKKELEGLDDDCNK